MEGLKYKEEEHENTKQEGKERTRERTN